MDRNSKLNDWMAVCILVLYFAELVFPMINSFFSPSIVCFVCFILWNAFTWARNPSYFTKKRTLKTLSIYLFLIGFPYLAGYSVIAHRYMNMGLVVGGCLIYDYYYENGKLAWLKKSLTSTFALSIITLAITLIALIENPYISRSIKSSGEYSDILASQGIGGYSFVYYVAILCVILLYYVLKSHRIKDKVFGIIAYFIGAYFAIKSNYMTAFLLVVLGSGTLIFFELSAGGRRGVFKGFVALMGIVILALNINVIIDMLSPIMPARIANILLNDGQKSIVDSIMNEFLFDRWPVMLESIQAFAQYPLGGIMLGGALTTSGEYMVGFGQHSFILDTFALYGIIGGFLVIYAIFQPFRTHREEKQTSIRMAMLVCLFVVYLLNNATESIGLTMTIIYPYIRDTVTSNERMNAI